MSDIEEYLKKQWSYLLQRLLYEQRNKIAEEKRLDFLSKQIEDIKTAILTTIPNDELKDTAKGAIRFRGLIEFFLDFKLPNMDKILLSKVSWDQLFEQMGIKEFKSASDPKRKFSTRNGVAFLLKDDESRFYFAPYLSVETIEKLVKVDWEEFKNIPENRKNAIFNAIKDNFVEGRFMAVHEIKVPFTEWLQTNDGKE